jgi:CheY-like chemotaxis protein
MSLLLLVDDSPVNLVVGQAMLEALGYSVRTATGGHDAVRCCQNGIRPDLVLMDVNMPEGERHSSDYPAESAAARRTMAPFPIVGFTAAWTDELRVQCLQSGMDECLPKPLVIGDLAPRLRRIVTLA